MKKRDNRKSNTEIGQRLKQLRRECGMSQLDAAKVLGVTQSCISQLENGQRFISGATAIQLAELYNAEPGEIFGSGRTPDNTGIRSDVSRSLLDVLAKSSGSDELLRSVRNYSAIAAYRMLRAIWMLNPDNSREIFMLSNEDADRLSDKFLSLEPFRVRSPEVSGKTSDRRLINLPPEDTAELRAFIAECEALLKSTEE